LEQPNIVHNFGRNLRFKPSHAYSPINKDELIDILENIKVAKFELLLQSTHGVA